MNGRASKICAYISVILFFGFVGTFVYVEQVSSNPQLGKSGAHWSYGSIGNLHVTATKLFGGTLIFFNQPLPYLGSITGFDEDKANMHEVGCDWFGITFRMFDNPDNKNGKFWTLVVNLWYPITFFGVLPVVFLIRNKTRQKSP